MPLIGRDRVVHVGRGRAPIPQADDHVALQPCRPVRMGGRQLARRDPIRPIGIQRQALIGTELGDRQRHADHRLTRLDAPGPHLGRVRELAQFFHVRRADVLAAQRMAGLAGVLDRIDPIALCPQDGRDAVALVASARELVGGRDVEHRVPIHARIVLRGGSRRGCRRGGEIERLAGLAIDPGRVDEAVAPHPHLVFRGGQGRDHVSPGIVGHDDLGKFRGQVGCFRDDPNASFRPVRAGHGAADVRGANGD